MYITINDIIGEKTINLSYPIRSGKEVAVITILSDNIQYEIVKTQIIDYIPTGNKKISGGTYAGRKLISMLEGVIEPTQTENDERVTKMNMLKGLTEMTLNLGKLDNTDNL